MNFARFVSACPAPIKARATGNGKAGMISRELNTQKHGLNKSRTLANMAYNGLNQFKHTGFINKEVVK